MGKPNIPVKTTTNSVRKLLPGQPGTKKWFERFGDRLVCVRYRYDAERRRKTKTVEIVVDEGPWLPNSKRIPHNKVVYVRIKYGEAHLGRIAREVGGKWNREKKLWEMPYKEAIAMGFQDRIVGAKDKNG
ncbi:MAG: hypothetical protein ACE5I1_09235 [bacterium]